MRLPAGPRRLLLALAAGRTLKAHRDLDGRKLFRLHRAEGGPAEAVQRRLAEALADAGLIDSNKKFPAATFWLTEAGRQVAAGLLGEAERRAEEGST